MIDYRAAARNAVDTVMRARVEALPAFMELGLLYLDRMAQDIVERPNHYTPHIERAAAIHPEIPDHWQNAVDRQRTPFHDHLTIELDASIDMFAILLTILYPTTNLNTCDLWQQAQQELADNPELSRWIKNLRRS